MLAVQDNIQLYNTQINKTQNCHTWPHATSTVDCELLLPTSHPRTTPENNNLLILMNTRTIICTTSIKTSNLDRSYITMTDDYNKTTYEDIIHSRHQYSWKQCTNRVDKVITSSIILSWNHNISHSLQTGLKKDIHKHTYNRQQKHTTNENDVDVLVNYYKK